MIADFVFFAFEKAFDVVFVLEQDNCRKHERNGEGNKAEGHFRIAEGVFCRQRRGKENERFVEQEKGANGVNQRKKNGRKRDVFCHKHHGKKQRRADEKQPPVKNTDHGGAYGDTLAALKAEKAGIDVPDKTEKARNHLKKVGVGVENFRVHAAENQIHNRPCRHDL